jgi:23S rRNA (uracil1939-C5)-methyltransferase
MVNFMTIKNGDKLTVEITGFGGFGDGMATYENSRVVVPFTMPGDLARVKVTDKGDKLVTAELLEITKKSAGRTDAPCKHFGECGGCSLQHLSREAYSDYKRNVLVSSLTGAGFSDKTIEPLTWVGEGSRRRAKFHVQINKKTVELGYYKRNTHRIIDLAMCPVLEDDLQALIPTFRDLIISLNCARAVKELEVLASDSGLEVQMQATTEIDGADRKRLEAFADTNNIARLIWRSRQGAENVVYAYPSQLDFGDVSVELPKGAFVQASKQGQALITAEVNAALGECSRVVDLYSGCGTYSFPLALAGVNVVTVEGANEMVQAIKRAITTHELTNIQAQHRDLYKRPMPAADLAEFDGVVINPPRNGAEPQMKEIAASGIKNVVVVSCNPRTLERDAKCMKEHGYQLVKAVPIDQFYWSAHLESVSVFTKN